MSTCNVKGKAHLAGVYALSLLSILLWGLSYLWSDSLLSKGIPVEYIVFVRIFIAGLVLLVVNLLIGNNLKMKKQDLPKFLLLALFEPFIYFVAETYGIRFTESPTISALLIAASPIFSVAVGVVIFKEKFTFFNMLGILICLGGIVMVTLCHERMGDAFLLGLLLLVVAVLAEVGHASFTKLLSDTYNPLVIVMYQFMIGSIFLFPLFLGSGLKSFDVTLYMSWEVWETDSVPVCIVFKHCFRSLGIHYQVPRCRQVQHFPVHDSCFHRIGRLGARSGTAYTAAMDWYLHLMHRCSDVAVCVQEEAETI